MRTVGDAVVMGSGDVVISFSGSVEEQVVGVGLQSSQEVGEEVLRTVEFRMTY